MNLPPSYDWEYHHWQIRGYHKDFEPRQKHKEHIALKAPKHKSSLKAELWYAVKALPVGTLIDKEWLESRFDKYTTVRKYLLEAEFVGDTDKEGNVLVMAIIEKVSKGSEPLVMKRVG